jgi:CheY-like chemotaxis protein
MEAVPPHHDLRVLVVDDHPDAATSLAYLLQLLGCNTRAAFNGAKALTIGEEFRPSLVFLDLDMPGLDGIEVLRRAREQGEGFEQSLFVCLTGVADAAARRRCLTAGFDRFVNKPIDVVEIQALLTEAMRRTVRS